MHTDHPSPTEPLYALVEALAVFTAGILVFLLGRALTPPAALLAFSGGLPVMGYLALLLLGLVVYYRVAFPALPDKSSLRQMLQVTWAGFFPALLLSSAIAWIGWSTLPNALGAALFALAMGLGFAWLARRLPDPVQAAAAVLPALLILAPMQASREPAILLQIIRVYAIIAPAEELLFRGAIQTLLNQAFGRPYSIFGIRWGLGLLVASLMFGLWHAALNPGSTTAWLQALWTACAGFFFGLVREKSGGVVAPSLLHGVLNFSPLAWFISILG